MGSVNDIGKESILSIDGEINLVTDFQHVNPGKGAAFVRTKMRNIRTGKTMDRTFKSNESVDFVRVERRKLQY
ncbi:MAG: elongation factor P, partial [Patescibacteria group bacterium]